MAAHSHSPLYKLNKSHLKISSFVLKFVFLWPQELPSAKTGINAEKVSDALVLPRLF